MFEYRYPIFKPKKLLRIEMLEQLRDYPRQVDKLIFRNYGNGILNGCELSWEENNLIIEPGLLIWKGHLYALNKPYRLQCPHNDKQVFLKIHFFPETNELDMVIGNTHILLDTDEPDLETQMELGRFRLQEGARLRNSYENYQDYMTEYDTINRIHVPFSCEGGTILWPQILCCFASKMLELNTQEILDTVFSMQILALQGKVSPILVQTYVGKYEKKDREYSNLEIYQSLSKILRKIKNDYPQNNTSKKAMGVVLL